MVFYWKTISLQQKSVHGFKIFTDLLRFRLQPVQPTLGTSHFFDLTDTFGAGRACEVLSQVRLQTTNAWEAIESSTNDPTHQEIGTECVCVYKAVFWGARPVYTNAHQRYRKARFCRPTGGPPGAPSPHRSPSSRFGQKAHAPHGEAQKIQNPQRRLRDAIHQRDLDASETGCVSGSWNVLRCVDVGGRLDGS